VDALRERCRAILRGNDQGGYTVPTHGLYPFQWLWDSGLVALGWHTFDEDRAWRELESLLAAQWPDGMVPHIVHHRLDTGYSLDHTFWDAPGPLPSSGITQPPVLATVARLMLEQARDVTGAERRVRTLVPRLLDFHRWLVRERDPDGTGLVAVLHPWEGGMDDSPTWDAALARVPRRPLDRPRPDTSHVDPAERPSDEQYERYVALVAAMRERRYAPRSCWRDAPFKVAGVAFNATLARAHHDLLALVERFGLPGAEELERWRDAARTGLATLWDDDHGLYHSRDLMTGEAIHVRTWECFMPLFAGAAERPRAARLAEELERLCMRTRYMLPSTHPEESAFEPRRYWRGPVWAPVNWLLADGCRRAGFEALAQRLRRDVFALVEQSGLREYYHPVSGDGLGGGAFSWTAAVLLDWLDGSGASDGGVAVAPLGEARRDAAGDGT
jgi:hypothetical protein